VTTVITFSCIYRSTEGGRDIEAVVVAADAETAIADGRVLIVGTPEFKRNIDKDAADSGLKLLSVEPIAELGAHYVTEPTDQ
jgi:hypothetical protein